MQALSSMRSGKPLSRPCAQANEAWTKQSRLIHMAKKEIGSKIGTEAIVAAAQD